MHEDVALFSTGQRLCSFADYAHETLEKSHGRIETRTTTATSGIAWLQDRHDRSGLWSVVMIERVRETGRHPGPMIECET